MRSSRLEAVLIGAAFKQDVTLAFIDDGVFQLMAGQDTAAAGMKNFSCTFKALRRLRTCDKFYVEHESLAERGLTIEDLMALAPDLAARRIKPEHLIDGVETMTTADLSTVSSRHGRTVAHSDTRTGAKR